MTTDPSASHRSHLPLPDPVRRVPAAIDRRGVTLGLPAFGPIRPPEEAPNVVLVLIDDMGFGAPSAFGGPIAMPVADSLAANGLAYTRFHTTGACSGTRAALLTGYNNHAVGMGTTPEIATSSPGYSSVRPRSAANVARILTLSGYSTTAFGKWHQTPAWEVSPAGPFDRWPTGEGFEHFYGFQGGEAHQYLPLLYQGTEPVDPPATPEQGYHLSEDLVNRAIAWVEQQRALDPGKPFFCYLAFGACHAPLHVSQEWVQRYRGEFDHGWTRQRELTLERQHELGVIPEASGLSPWPVECPVWDDLTDVERQAACRLMELYAGFASHTDAQVGRLIQYLQARDLLDNTLVLYMLGDNGASAEGGVSGTVNEWMSINGFTDSPEHVLAAGDALGGPTTAPHYPVGWALAMDTPYQWTKQVASHYGGTRNGLIVHWPAGIRAKGDFRHQWHHCIDIVPSILEAARLPKPTSVDGTPQMEMHGVSMLYSFDEAAAPDRHTTQYFELLGNRGIYHDGWVACTKHRTPWQFVGQTIPDFRDDRWELYDTRVDWTQERDLAAERPEVLEELKAIFLIEAARNNVLPLDDRLGELLLPDVAGRYNLVAGRMSVTYPGDTRQLPEDVVVNVRNRSHRVDARIVVKDAGTDGVIVSQGGAFGGWSLYVLGGRLTYCNNVVGRWIQHVRSDPLDLSAEHIVGFAFRYDGGGFGLGGLVSLLLDGEVVASERIERTTPFSFSIMDRFDVGVDLGTPVSPEYPPHDNAFGGEVEWVRISIDHTVPYEDASELTRVTMATQ